MRIKWNSFHKNVFSHLNRAFSCRNQKIFKFGKTAKFCLNYFFSKNASILVKGIFSKVRGRKLCCGGRPSCFSSTVFSEFSSTTNQITNFRSTCLLGKGQFWVALLRYLWMVLKGLYAKVVLKNLWTMQLACKRIHKISLQETNRWRPRRNQVLERIR